MAVSVPGPQGGCCPALLEVPEAFASCERSFDFRSRRRHFPFLVLFIFFEHIQTRAANVLFAQHREALHKIT